MSQEIPVNSNAYWDGRFNQDWETFEGPTQSRFFARIAINNLPSWFIQQLTTESLTIVDWGCAQGDGTDTWVSCVNAKQIRGIDFSAVAIEQARKRYPTIQFLHEDWITNINENTQYDVVFSSNTLEHFHNAFDVLNIISRHAHKAVVLALPYKELDRIEEHLFSFTPHNIPYTLPNGFQLVWSQVIDCKSIPNTMWSGDQIILIYADLNWINALKLNLSHFSIELEDSRAALDQLRTELTKKENKITELNLTLTTNEQKIAKLNLAFTANEQKFSQLNQTLTERNQQIEKLSQASAEMEHTNKLQLHKMMQLSDWASKINAKPIRYGVLRYIRAFAKTLFHVLPLSLEHKQVLRTQIAQMRKSATPPVDTNHASTNQVIQRVHQTAGNPLWHTKYLYANPITHSNNDSLLNDRDIFIFSVIDWDFRIQRPQHLARSFAKAGQRVFFFSNHFIDSPIAGYEIQKLDPALELYQIKLHVSGAPAIYFAPPTDDALSMMQQGITQLMFEFASLGSISVIQHAYWFSMACKLPNTIRIYDCMDHHEGFGNVPEKLIEIEKTMLSDSDLVVVTSTWLETLAQQHNTNVAVIRNAGEYEHFCTPPAKIYQDLANRQIIGYFGAIAEWFDLELIQSLAKALPDALILLVGNDTINASKALKKLNNVILTGEVPYDQLPFYVHAFDVCLLPFQIIPLTMATNPVKVYEYLAASKPVVSVDLPEIAQFGNLVKSAKTHHEFIQLVSESLNATESQTDSDAPLRLSFAREQTWNHRIQTLTEVIHNLPLPKISIVVLTYNNLDLTKKCLDSLLRWNDYPNTEIIVVDNASTDETPEYLQTFQIDHPESLVILNDQNLGFSAGNNVGLKVATGDYLVILNNDTVVTPGWLLTMLRHLQADPTIGLIGPVTNNIGNEAKISVQYETFDEMLPLALSQITTHMGKHFPLKTAAFFCAMIPRSVFEKVGYLDENFGLGFFEDDDYCRRVEQLGMKIVCAEDVFIHHHLSASFNKLKSSTRQALFENNKAYYESKWGQWFAHEYRN